MAIIGIDLGTTNSLAAVWKDGCSQLIPNAFGDMLTPSVVSVDEEGTVYVGKIAKERLISHPENTASVFKRFMGTGKIFSLGDKMYRAEELSAYVLKKMKTDAEAYLGEPVTEAIVSVPAYFNNAQRDATKRAGELAGLVVNRIINEPSAAALACQHLYPEEETLEVVFDFGGGTLDVSVVDLFDNVIDVVSISGDNHLGGVDFDTAIADYFCKEKNLDFSTMTPPHQAAILKSAEACKMALSDSENVEMSVSFDGETITMPFDMDTMIKSAASIFKRMTEPLRKAVAGAELEWEEIRRIVLVGGSCKMPAVRLYLQHFLKKETIFLGSPDTIVALGTGTYAGIKERQGEIREMLLTDVCPFTLGIELYNGEMSPIIERNQALPCSKSHQYVTVNDFQKFINVCVYQGESMCAQDNIKLGDIDIPVPNALAGQEAIDVRFTYDINGILEVDVKGLRNGDTRNLLIIDEKNSMTEAELKETRHKLQKLKLHPQEREENMLLLSKCESLFMQAGPNLRNFLSNEMSYFQYLLAMQNDLKIKKGRRRIEKAISMVEEKLNIFMTPEDFEELSTNWYEEAKQEELENGEDDFEAWFGKGHLTS